MQVPFDSSVRLHVIPQTAASQPLLVTNLEEWSNSTKDTVSLTQRVPFFKCFAFDIDLDTPIPCSFTTNVRNEYTHHLKLQHKNALYACIYCSESENVKQLELFDMGIYLVRHIDAKHNNRTYQCNQCNYRALSPEHVSLHQSLTHTKSTISGCKVLSCSVPRPSTDLELEHFYEYFKVDNACLTTYQCLYCSVYSISLSVIVAHLVENHPDYPMLYYLPTPQDTSLQNDSRTSNSISSSPNGFHSDDEPYASNEDDEVMCLEETYVCFFCSKYTSISSRQMKAHLYTHLFDIEQHPLRRKSPDDAFFLNWLHNFVNMQNSYLDDDNLCESYFHSLCHICIDLSQSRGLAFPSSTNSHEQLSLTLQKAHFILHSCFKSIKCCFCAQEEQGDFWMPDLKSVIVMHLYICHRSQMDAIPELYEFELFHFARLRELSDQEWQSNFKQILLKEQVIIEFSSSEITRYNWKFSNQEALKKLEQRFNESVSKFDAMIATLPEETNYENHIPDIDRSQCRSPDEEEPTCEMSDVDDD